MNPLNDVLEQNERKPKSDLEMAKMLGISRQLYQLYRTHPERLPDYPILTALLDSPLWEDVIGYLKGRVSKKQLINKIRELQDGKNDED